MPSCPVPPGVDSALDALTALGEAWRHDWSEFDGRTLRAQLNDLSRTIRKAAAGEDVKGEIAAFYAVTDMCPRCRSWTDHCRCDGV